MQSTTHVGMSSKGSRKRSLPGSSASQPVFSSTGDGHGCPEGRLKPPLPTTASVLSSRRKKGKQGEGGRSIQILEGREICTSGFTMAANVSEAKRGKVWLMLMMMTHFCGGSDDAGNHTGKESAVTT